MIPVVNSTYCEMHKLRIVDGHHMITAVYLSIAGSNCTATLPGEKTCHYA